MLTCTKHCGGFCRISFTPDYRTMFINIQHPGEAGDSHWPSGGQGLPRSATVVITKDDGGVIGT